MLAAPAAAVVAVLLALRPVAAAARCRSWRSLVVLARRRWRCLALLPDLAAAPGAQPLVLAQLAAPGAAAGPGGVLVVVAAVPVQLLLSRQSFSAAMARITP